MINILSNGIILSNLISIFSLKDYQLPVVACFFLFIGMILYWIILASSKLSKNNILFNIPDCPRQTIIVQMLKTIIKFAEENPAKIVLLSVRDKRAVAKSAKIPGTKEGNNERAHMIVVDDKIQRNSLG